VDNNSSDGSSKLIRERYPKVILVSLPVNLGFGKAVNLAARRCSGQYLWLLNSDCRVRSDVASKMVYYLEGHPDTAAVTGRLISEDGSFQASCRRLPTFRNVFFSRQSPLSRIFPRRTDYTLPDCDVPTVVDACACSSMVMSRERFIGVGGFDPRFFMYCEDTDLCLRLAARGLKVVFLPDAEVIHLCGRSWRRSRWMRHYNHHRSMIRYFHKHFPNNAIRLGLLEFLLILGLGIRVMSLMIWSRR
jgi:GT2 family glycosyltransferase